jgi:glutathione S-transferase
MNHFYSYAPEDVPYAKKRFLDEGKRLFKVLDTQLEGKEYIVGDYSIADISIYGWIKAVRNHPKIGNEFDAYPNVDKWLKLVGDRPAVQRGVLVCKL